MKARLLICAVVLGIGLTKTDAQTVGFVAASGAPVFCKYQVRAELGPAPLAGFALPVYAKAPDRDFWILGEMMINGRGIVRDTPEARPWAVRQLAAAAKDRGADAVWLVRPFAGRYCQAVVIKWTR